MSILTRKLTEDEQVEILDKLFGFYFEEDVLKTKEGKEFYGTPGNSLFDFSTLFGVFEYAIKTGINIGYNEAQNDIKKALGL